MTETFSVYTERVDDIPLLLQQIQHMDLEGSINRHLRAHGNRQGLSYGGLAVVWLTHILSQADHRISHVRGWAQQRLYTLQPLLPHPMVETDFTDDRLADLLRALSDDVAWEALEADLNQRTIAVYDLPASVVRLDTTTVSVDTEPEGLFRHGHSKDHRPDLVQVKVLLATLDPLALPLLTQVLPGNAADDPLYLPAVEAVRKSLQRRGLLYVGDCKMAALATRAGIASGQDYYLCPLSALQMSTEQLAVWLEPVLAGRQPLQSIQRRDATGKLKEIAEGFEVTQPQRSEAFGWSERRLVVRSLAFAEAAARGLDTRLASAQQQIAALTKRGRGKHCPADAAAAQQAVAAILSRFEVSGLLRVAISEQRRTRTVRAYADQPARQEDDIHVEIYVDVDAAAVVAAKSVLGWRVFATKAPAPILPLSEAVLVYRDEYRIEQGFGRLKGQPLSVSPLYVSRQDHATGLVRLLSLGLRVLCLLEFVVRRQLAKQQSSLSGLYAGNPKQATTMPTAERLLEAFQNITLTVIVHSGQRLRHLTPLTGVQQRILELLSVWPQVYTRLLDESGELVPQMGET